MDYLWIHGFHFSSWFSLGLHLCLSIGFMSLLCSFGFAYTVILKRRGVLCTKGQGGVVAGNSVFHNHHCRSAWQRTKRRQAYRDTGMMETDWATAGKWRYRDYGDGLGEDWCTKIQG